MIAGSTPAIIDPFQKARTMRLVLISIASWFLCLGLLVSGLNLVQSTGVSTLNNGAVISLVTTALAFSLAYGPLLLWLRSRLGRIARGPVFPLTSALVLNLPIFLIAMLANGRTLLPAEAYAVMISFAAMGAAFGIGFVWSPARPRGITSPAAPRRVVTRNRALVS